MKEAKQATPGDVTKYRWADIASEQLNPLLSRKLITGDRVMLSELELKKGCVVPAHHHENEQVTYILRGALKFEVGGKEIILYSRSEERRVGKECRSRWS